MKVLTLNLNGIRAAAKKGLFDWIAQQDPDVLCFQETKAAASQLIDPIFHPQNYYRYYHDAEKKGYSGVAIYTKRQPDNVIKDLDYRDADQEGRYLQIDYPGLSIVSLYLPSGTSGALRQDIKFKFLDFYGQLLEKQQKDPTRDWIIAGDFNIAHTPLDIKNWKTNQKNSGFLPEERAWLDKVFGDWGYIDTYRQLYPTLPGYTWWSLRSGARARNVGWRIDYQIITRNLATKLLSAEVFAEPIFSDHAPLLVTYNLSL